jgi:hypothetical protein
MQSVVLLFPSVHYHDTIEQPQFHPLHGTRVPEDKTYIFGNWSASCPFILISVSTDLKASDMMLRTNSSLSGDDLAATFHQHCCPH